MFGYVNVNLNELDDTQKERYRSFYCGVCHALSKRHGQTGRLALSYDMAFLALLLSALYEDDDDQVRATHYSHCAIHPVHKHPWVQSPYVDYAADMTIALSYYNLLDDWQDDHSLPSFALAHTLQNREHKVAAEYPIQCCAIHHCLAQLSRYERENCQDLDLVAGCFGELLAEIFDSKHDLWSGPLREMGTSLGKFIYLMDAYDDLEKDLRHGRYNPLSGIAAQPDYEERCHDILTLMMAQAAKSFEKLPIVQDADILRNILYSGVWCRYTAHRADLERKSKGETTK